MVQQMRIGELARRVGVNTKTIRYYEQIGLLAAPLRSENGYRLYSPRDETRLAFICRARILDFSLGEIKEILDCRASGRAPCSDVLHLIHRKVAIIEKRIEELERLKRELRGMERAATQTNTDAHPHLTEFCHILETPRGRTAKFAPLNVLH